MVAVMERTSCENPSCRVSNTLVNEFRLEALEEAMAWFAAPKIFNKDQGR
jgi:hypothetical protein